VRFLTNDVNVFFANSTFVGSSFSHWQGDECLCVCIGEEIFINQTSTSCGSCDSDYCQKLSSNCESKEYNFCDSWLNPHWDGEYTLNIDKCNTSSCCCFTGTMKFKQHGKTVKFDAETKGVGCVNSSIEGKFTINNDDDMYATFDLNDQKYLIVKGQGGKVQLTIINLNSAECSEELSCESGACYSYLRPVYIILIAGLIGSAALTTVFIGFCLFGRKKPHKYQQIN